MDPAQDLNQLTKNPTPTLGDTVEEFEEKQNDYQAAYNAGGSFKERLEVLSAQWKKEDLVQLTAKAEIKEVNEIPELPEVKPEVAGYVERVEKEPELNQALADDFVKQVGMVNANPQQSQIKVPLTNDQIQQGLHRKVWESIRWLAVWCHRQLKMLSLKRA
ncbi:MAG: hypothetical protein Q7S31_03075 [bacterium]|nr:hypothetical protein [bacterium]